MARLFDQPSSDDTTVDDAFYQCWNCGALCDRNSPHACDTEACERGDVGTVGDDAPPEPTCYFCGEPLPNGETDYCSSLCAAMAERDNQND